MKDSVGTRGSWRLIEHPKKTKQNKSKRKKKNHLLLISYHTITGYAETAFKKKETTVLLIMLDSSHLGKRKVVKVRMNLRFLMRSKI